MRRENKNKPKTTSEIRSIIKNANMDFDAIVNSALNEYLPKLFLSCPFTDELCIQQRQCIGCSSAQSHTSVSIK